MITRRMAWLAALTVFSAAILFALYTQLAWDDWYITYRASKNMAQGNGLTFTPGEHVHSFTSPAGTLIPGLLSYIVGNTNDDLVLWLFRVLNSLTLGAAAAMLVVIMSRFKVSLWAIAALIAMAFLDAKTLANTINGMETATLIFFVVLTLLVMQKLPSFKSALLLGVAWAGLMWARPDGIVYIAAFTIAAGLFAKGGWPTRLGLLKSFAIAALLAAVLYGPWLIWAQNYYGSFVPHTIIAKSMTKPHIIDTISPTSLFRFVTLRTENWREIFLPPYGSTFGGWPHIFIAVSCVLAWLSSFAWVVPQFRREGRMISLVVFILQVYFVLGMEHAFPWYYPPVALLSFCVIAIAIDQFSKSTDANRVKDVRRPILVKSAAGAITSFVVVMTLMTAVQLRFFQSTIYDGNYKLVGLWLRDHAASPRDTVFLEPLGYIGFYSGLKMYDYPGLSSDEMIQARKHFPIHDLAARDIFADLIPFMKPDWLVLRPLEISLIAAKRPDLLSNDYHEVRAFDVSDKVSAEPNLPGLPWLHLEQKFVVFKRVS